MVLQANTCALWCSIFVFCRVCKLKTVPYYMRMFVSRPSLLFSHIVLQNVVTCTRQGFDVQSITLSTNSSHYVASGTIISTTYCTFVFLNDVCFLFCCRWFFGSAPSFGGAKHTSAPCFNHLRAYFAEHANTLLFLIAVYAAIRSDIVLF